MCQFHHEASQTLAPRIQTSQGSVLALRTLCIKIEPSLLLREDNHNDETSHKHQQP